MLAIVSIIVVLCGLIAAISATSSLQKGATTNLMNVTFKPSDGVHMMSGKSINITIWYDFTTPSFDSADQFVLVFSIKNSLVSSFSGISNNLSIIIDPKSRDVTESPLTVELHGHRVGITALTASLLNESGVSTWTTDKDYAIRVTKIPSTLNTGLRLGTIGAMSLNFLTFGCKLRYGTLKRYIMHPSGIVIGFLCQYGLMPTITYVLGRACSLPAHMAFSLFAVGCAPGGGPSNLLTTVVHGDLHMSIIMTFFSTVFAIGMIPLWMYTVGRLVLQEGYPRSEINIPWAVLGIAVVWFSLPTAIGMLLGRYCPRLANLLVLILRPVALLVLLALVIVFIYLNYAVLMFADTWQVLFVSAATPYVAFALSFVLAFFFSRFSVKVALTIMVETGIQNITFAFFIIVATLPQPDGDIASVVPLLVIFFTYGPIFFIAFPIVAIHRRMTRHTKARYSIVDLARGVEVLAEGQEPSKESSKLDSKPSGVSLESIQYIEDDGFWPVKIAALEVTDSQEELEGGHM